MPIDYAVGAGVSVLLAFYLGWALLRPERFG
jgi:K+-transporting ATPase KdpF subunit